MKIALIKQDTYQDLYVCANRTNIDELLLSTQMRVGMFGLFSMYDADFYIVKEAKDKECSLWKKVLPQRVKIFRELPYKTLNQLEGMEFQCPGSDKPNGYYSIDVDSIDYDAYDVIISINISVPYRIVKKHPNVLWAYMIGEANFLQDKAYMGYDVSLNQLIRGCCDEVNGIIDFPYTFVGPDCLEKAVERIVGRKACKKGIYGEVNCVKERPVKRIPQFEPISDATGQPIVLHDQHIKNNLVKIYDSKYYLKVGGRHTRGNGVLEAISLGTVVLMSPDDLICGQVLPKDAWVFSAADATKKIKELDENSDLYQKLLTEERMLLKQFVVDYPMHNLENALLRKRKKGKSKFLYWVFQYEVLKRSIKKRNNQNKEKENPNTWVNEAMSWIKECATYISADLFRYTGKSGLSYFIKQYFIRGQGFRFSVWLRICHFSKIGKVAKYTIFPLARMIYNHYMIKYGYDISYNTDIGPGLLIYHFSGIVFRPEKAGKNMTISQCTTVGMTIHNGEKSYPVLGDNVYLAPGSKVIGGIVVGNNVSIGANAVLTNSVSDNAVVVGIPGKIISYRGSSEYINNPWLERNS